MKNSEQERINFIKEEWEKFLKPEDLISIQKKNDLFIEKVDGMKFNIIGNEWKISSDKSVNYITKYKKA